MISSRTPEGEPNRCPVCGADVCVDPSTVPGRDGPCPHCGTLMTFADIVTEITVRGMSEEDLLLRLGDEMARGGRRRLVLDFRGVRHMPSVALGRLILLHRALARSGGALLIRNVSRSIMDVFRLTKLDQMLDFDEE